MSFRHDWTQKVIYLCLFFPEFSLFGTVHLTVDDQNVRQTSNVACLNLKRYKYNLIMQKRGSKSTACSYEQLIRLKGSWNSLWADTSRSFHTTPECSAPDRCSSSRSQQSHIPLLFSLRSQVKWIKYQLHTASGYLCPLEPGFRYNIRGFSTALLARLAKPCCAEPCCDLKFKVLLRSGICFFLVLHHDRFQLFQESCWVTAAENSTFPGFAAS